MLKCIPVIAGIIIKIVLINQKILVKCKDISTGYIAFGRKALPGSRSSKTSKDHNSDSFPSYTLDWKMSFYHDNFYRIWTLIVP
jgi:hypothetical protein